MDRSRIIKELDVFNGIKVNNNFEGGN